MNQIVIEEANTWRLVGELTFATVDRLLTEFTQSIAQTPPKILVLCDVTRTDSAGLALLIEWLKQTKDAPITFHNIPTQMLSIATISGVQDMLIQNSTHHIGASSD